MKRIFMTLILMLILTACGGSGSSSVNRPVPSATKIDLPQHTVGSNTSLAPKDGRRIEIHVSNTNLTKDECRLLINAYKEKAGPEGQASVRKPNKDGELKPWCVDNMDGKGISFNDFHFE